MNTRSACGALIVSTTAPLFLAACVNQLRNLQGGGRSPFKRAPPTSRS
jgi:hypothetical protein